MKKSDIITMPEYFDRYINLTGDYTVVDSLRFYDANWLESEKEAFIQIGDLIYSPQKWTVKDILQHLIDTERIFAYRALCFAREDTTILPGFDEDKYAHSANTSLRTVDDLFHEIQLVRNSTIALYNSFSKEMMLRGGICFQKKISVLAIGFVISGHAIHHLNVIKERYYPLLNH